MILSKASMADDSIRLFSPGINSPEKTICWQKKRIKNKEKVVSTLIFQGFILKPLYKFLRRKSSILPNKSFLVAGRFVRG
jgi:hypothetical protein